MSSWLKINEQGVAIGISVMHFLQKVVVRGTSIPDKSILYFKVNDTKITKEHNNK